MRSRTSRCRRTHTFVSHIGIPRARHDERQHRTKIHRSASHSHVVHSSFNSHIPTAVRALAMRIVCRACVVCGVPPPPPSALRPLHLPVVSTALRAASVPDTAIPDLRYRITPKVYSISIICQHKCDNLRRGLAHENGWAESNTNHLTSLRLTDIWTCALDVPRQFDGAHFRQRCMSMFPFAVILWIMLSQQFVSTNINRCGNVDNVRRRGQWPGLK